MHASLLFGYFFGISISMCINCCRVWQYFTFVSVWKLLTCILKGRIPSINSWISKDFNNCVKLKSFVLRNFFEKMSCKDESCLWKLIYLQDFCAFIIDFWCSVHHKLLKFLYCFRNKIEYRITIWRFFLIWCSRFLSVHPFVVTKCITKIQTRVEKRILA